MFASEELTSESVVSLVNHKGSPIEFNVTEKFSASEFQEIEPGR